MANHVGAGAQGLPDELGGPLGARYMGSPGLSLHLVKLPDRRARAWSRRSTRRADLVDLLGRSEAGAYFASRPLGGL
jgi:hypothetical protein